MANRLVNILLSPLHAAQVFSGFKDFDSPVVGSERLNKRGLHIWRMKATHALADRRRKRLEHLLPAADRAAFARDGFVEKRGLLSPADHAALLVELRALKAPAREMIQGGARTRRIAITPELLRSAPALKKLLDTPEWRNLTRYIGAFDIDPIICIQTIFGAASAKPSKEDPQTRLHMDTFHPTMKAWYFLEDVAADQGPFTYVPGSHALTRRRVAWHKYNSVRATRPDGKRNGSFRVPENHLRLLRLPERRVFSVPGNTLVVGDTFGLHARGLSLRPSVRVEIYASMRPNPWNPFTSLDTAYLPFVRGRKLPIGWWFEDLAAKLGLEREIWKDIGIANPWQK